MEAEKDAPYLGVKPLRDFRAKRVKPITEEGVAFSQAANVLLTRGQTAVPVTADV